MIVPEETRNAVFDNVKFRDMRVAPVKLPPAEVRALWHEANRNPALPDLLDVLRKMEEVERAKGWRGVPQPLYCSTRPPVTASARRRTQRGPVSARM